MTAIDAAIQARLLGAEEVTICYRRGKQHLNASEWEQDLAASKGVTIRPWLRPLRVLTEGGRVTGIELAYTALEAGRPAGTAAPAPNPTPKVFRPTRQRPLQTGSTSRRERRDNYHQ